MMYRIPIGQPMMAVSDQSGGQEAEQLQARWLRQKEKNKRSPAQRQVALHREPQEPLAEQSQDGEQTAILQEEQARQQRQLQRLAADFENYKRHAEAQLAAARQQASQEVLSELGETIKGLEQALCCADQDPQAIRQGVALVSRGLEALLAKHGVERIPTVGQLFDPALHDAVLVERDQEQPKGTILRELAPGFTSAGRVLRTAKVSVAA